MASSQCTRDKGSCSERTGNHSPYTTLGVQHGQLERSTSRAIKFLNISFLLRELATEGCGPDHRGTTVSIDNFCHRYLSRLVSQLMVCMVRVRHPTAHTIPLILMLLVPVVNHFPRSKEEMISDHWSWERKWAYNEPCMHQI